MKQEEFIKRLSCYVRTVFNDDLDRTDFPYLEIKSWFMEIKALKSLTDLVDFGCGFNGKDQCRLYHGSENSNRCCCNNCHGANGHLSNVQLTDIPKIARRFKKDVGFWRQGKGCILPRELRSDTCVTYLCRVYDGREADQSNLARRQCRAITAAIDIFRTKIRERSIELKLR